MEKHQFIVNDSQSGMRIDLFLSAMLPLLSRRKVRTILDVGGCYVNNKRMHIASRQVRGGDKVRVEFSLQALSSVRQKAFILLDNDVLFDQDHVIAINKPPGLPSQATRDQDVMHAEVCLANWLKSKGRIGEKPFLTHRLDKETSGVLLFATNANTATWITDQFKQRALSKTYWAICFHIPPRPNFICECYLSDIDYKTGLVSVVRSGGKSSRTEFSVIQSDVKTRLSFIECRPETGRSHQIRVHLESLGFPIIGDKRYGRQHRVDLPPEIAEESQKHQMLHARSLKFTAAPGLSEIEVFAEVPASFASIQNRLWPKYNDQ